MPFCIISRNPKTTDGQCSMWTVPDNDHRKRKKSVFQEILNAILNGAVQDESFQYRFLFLSASTTCQRVFAFSDFEKAIDQSNGELSLSQSNEVSGEKIS